MNRFSLHALWRMARAVTCAGALSAIFLSAWSAGAAPSGADAKRAADDLAALAALVKRMPANGWLEIPNSRIPLISRGEAEKIGVAGITGPISVVLTWNGAAFDGRRWRFHGGGHADYGGNEVYEFDFRTLKWTRTFGPSPLTGPPLTMGKNTSGAGTPAEGPAAMHTYDGFVHSPKTGKDYLFGVTPFALNLIYSAEYPAWEFDPETRKWAPFTDCMTKLWSAPAKTALLPDGNILYARRTRLVLFDPATRKCTLKNAGAGWWEEGTGAYDPKLNRFYVVTDGYGKQLGIFDLGKRGAHFRHVGPLPPFEKPNPGVTYHPPSGRLVAWDGGRSVWTFDPKTEKWTRYGESAAGPKTRGAGVFGKWIYIPELDVFAGYNDPDRGMWLYKPDFSKAEGAFVPPAVTPKQLLENAKDGATITLPKGEFKECAIVRASNVTIVGTGTKLHSQICEDKAVLVTKGSNITIVGLEVADGRCGGNCAAVRMEGANLTLKKVHFHDNEMNVLTGNGTRLGSIVIEDSLFENSRGASNKGHSLYAGTIAETIVRRSTFKGAWSLGHVIKSRAAKTTIEDSVIWQGDSQCSLAIDLPQGGQNVVRRNVIEQGTRTDNADIIGVAKEVNELWKLEDLVAEKRDTALAGRSKYPEWPDSRTIIEDNLIISDWSNPNYVPGPHWSILTAVTNGGSGEVVFRNNVVVWPGKPFSWRLFGWKGATDGGGNVQHLGRAAAGLEPYPAIPVRAR